MKKLVLVAVVVVALVGLALGAGAWYFLTRAAPAAAGPMTAIPIVSGEQAAGSASAGQPAPAAGSDSGSAATAQPAGATGGAATFVIDPSQSEARFTLGEILAGSPNTVVGATRQVSGEIVVDPQQPQAARVGTITVDARGFATDNAMRNRTIQTFILNTRSYEYITFVPTAVSGLPSTVTVGRSFTFQVTGDLTIRDVTKSVVFDVKLTPASATRLEGLASAAINRADFKLTIPNVPRVAGVDEKVLLELEFVATPKG